MASITLEHISKRYRDVEAVRDFGLHIPDGDLLMLVGPSGCGKTTVLRLIAGLETPDTGSVYFDGEDVATVPPRDRNIAMVFEGYALFPHMRVRDNLAFALRLRKTPKEVVDRRVAAVAEAMELDHLLARRPPGLATGEAQHVAVGRAVVRETPSVVLLDDALSHLDARQRLEARVEVGHLHRDLGCTIVSVTHDQEEALAIGTRIAVMDAGGLMQSGTPPELYERPGSVFVAGFIGSPAMNLMEMRLERENGRAWLRRDGLELPAPERATALGHTHITMGIRPEDVRLTAPSGSDEMGFRGRCDLVEYLGPKLLVHVRVGTAEIIMLDDASDDVHRGDVVDCAIRLDRLFLFDTGTGRALGRAADPLEA